MSQTAQEVMQAVNSALGGNVLRMGSDKSLEVQYINTGLLPMDILMHGGLPKGRFTLVVGDYSTLKSYIGYHSIRECQRQGGTAALIDTEKAFDPEWAKSIGVNVDDLIIYPPRDAPEGKFFPGELAIDTAEALTRAGVDLIVFDSIAATLPQAEQNKRLHDENIQPARVASLFSAACRRLTAANNKTAYLWINQYRLNVGVTFGNPQVITGGRAMPYYSSMIIEMKKAGKITRDVKMYDGEKWKGGKEMIGQKFQATITKSKLSKPFRDIFFDWDMTTGSIDLPGFLMAQGMEHGLIKQTKNTFEYKPKGIKAVGRAKFKAKMASDPDVLADIENAVRTVHSLPQLPSGRKPRKTTTRASKGRSGARNAPPSKRRSLKRGK